MAIIRVRSSNNKIRFRHQGIRFEEFTGLTCEESGKPRCRYGSCRAARATGAEIEAKKIAGTFVFKTYFPNSDRALEFSKTIVAKNITFYDYARDIWLPSKQIEHSTIKGYKKQINNVNNALASHNVTMVKDAIHSHFAAILKSWTDKGNAVKTIRNNLFMAKEIFKSAISDNLIIKNPLEDIKVPSKKKIEFKIPKRIEGQTLVSEMDDEIKLTVNDEDKNIDPFSEDEVKLILNDLKTNDEEWAAYFAIGFFMGLRTGERMALTWHDVYLKNHLIHVHHMQTEGKHKNSTKTRVDYYADIIIDLEPYLIRHKELNFHKGEHLFYNFYGWPLANYNTVTIHWYNCLDRVGIRHREPYQTRHTFACMMLGRGIDMNWIKDQMGHKDLTMLLTTYGKYHRPGASNEKLTLYNNGRINLLFSAA